MTENANGNELWNIIGEAYGDDFRAGVTRKAVTAILAAGYRKPRIIITAEERTRLKPGTIAVDDQGNAWKRGTGSWVGTREGGPLFDDENLTLTILWEPATSRSAVADE